MNEAILVALISCGGTALGSLCGVLASARLTNFRLARLEEKVERHNHLVERMTVVEQSTRSAHHRIDSLERS